MVGRMAAGMVVASDEEAESIFVVITPWEVVRAPLRIETTLEEAEAIAPSTAVKRAPSEEEAVKIALLVLALIADSVVVIAEASEEEAVVTSA